MDTLPPRLSDNAIAEAWLGVFGLTSFLDGGSIKVSPATAAKVQRMTGEIRYLLRKFLAGEPAGKGESADIPEIKFREVADALFEEPTQEELATRLRGFPEEILPGLLVSAGKGLEYLRQALPVTRIATALTSDYRDPSPRDADAFERKFAVADDPLLAFKLLVAGRLSGDQAETFATIYPALYEHAKAEIAPLLVDVFGSKGKIELSYPRTLQLRTFLRDQDLNTALAAAVQEASQGIANDAKGAGGDVPTGKSPSIFDSATDSVAR